MQPLDNPATAGRSGKKLYSVVLFSALATAGIFYMIYAHGAARSPFSSDGRNAAGADTVTRDSAVATRAVVPLVLDTAEYNTRLEVLSNGDSSGRWPAKTGYPMAGAILPFKRIIAYYGNFYSKKMGVLGEYPPDTMLQKLQSELKKWEAADTTTAVVPALHYIAVTAQGYPGTGNKYRLRMPFKQIDSLIRMAARINALVFIDVQIGCSSLQDEIPLLEPYLKLPQVHLGIDPEFSMKTGAKPGTVIGTLDAADVNYTINYLAKVAKDNNLPPKILVVHRFTSRMVTNYTAIKPDSLVQVVMDMDGWGSSERKRSTYREYISKQPVEYTGFKLFYKNDYREPGSKMMTPEEVMKLKPRPIYIQYQ